MSKSLQELNQLVKSATSVEANSKTGTAVMIFAKSMRRLGRSPVSIAGIVSLHSGVYGRSIVRAAMQEQESNVRRLRADSKDCT